MQLRQIIQEAAKPYFDTTNYRTTHKREPRFAFDVHFESYTVSEYNTAKTVTFKR